MREPKLRLTIDDIGLFQPRQARLQDLYRRGLRSFPKEAEPAHQEILYEPFLDLPGSRDIDPGYDQSSEGGVFDFGPDGRSKLVVCEETVDSHCRRVEQTQPVGQ